MNIRSKLDQRGRGSQKGHAGEGGREEEAAEPPVPHRGLPFLVGTGHWLALALERGLAMNQWVPPEGKPGRGPVIW